VRLAAVQHAYPGDPRRDVDAALERAVRSVEGGGIAVLPEYFYKPTDREPTRAGLEELAFVEERVLEASRAAEGALVATVPRVDPPRNTAIVAEDGRVVLEQPKLYPTEPEREAGIGPGEGLRVAKVQGVRVGVLVCADVLALDLVREMARLEPDVVAVPVLSPARADDVTRAARSSVFVARAWDLGAYVVKAGGFHRPDAVGRSLVAAPWGLLGAAPDDHEPALVGTTFDRSTLERARAPFEGLGEAAETDG
jgi:predicted amidohydrolase